MGRRMPEVVLISLMLATASSGAEFSLSQLEPLPPLDSEVEEPSFDFANSDDLEMFATGPTVRRDDWTWQLFPHGIVYKSYLATPRSRGLARRSLRRTPTERSGIRH